MGFMFPFLLILSTIACAISLPIDGNEMHLNVLTQLDHVQKSFESLKFRMDMSDKISSLKEKNIDMEQLKENARKIVKPVFDIRIDTLPEHCQTEKLPKNCAEATECTQSSGYYNISVSHYRNDSFMAFCNYNFQQGDWLYILRREDGSVNFNLRWSDYVKGFGKVDGEYWIGLENLYALTNYDGPQELYVYIEDFNGESRYAKYDHFVIGNADEQYVLKSLGKYSGTAGDSLQIAQGSKFSTYDSDNEEYINECARGRKGGWWFNKPSCSKVNPTGLYLRGSYQETTSFYRGAAWDGFNGMRYSQKNIVFMIRRQRKTLV